MKKETIKNLLNNDRRTISKLLTLVESSTKNDIKEKEELISALVKKTNSDSKVIGFSGVTGSGKSSLIEELGKLLINEGKRIAVIAIDPSSPIHGGSILGDKTRMATLSAHPNCYVRPVPSKFNSGGISRSTRESIIIFKAAGYDYIFVETVGVGQTEYSVREVSDCFILNLLPATGDELQGVKKGINEVSDIVLINKADGALETQAELTVNEYKKTLEKPVLKTSIHDKKSISLIRETIEEYFDTQTSKIEMRKKEQLKNWTIKLVMDDIFNKVDEIKEEDLSLTDDPYQNKQELLRKLKLSI